MAYTPRLKEIYKNKIIPDFMEKFGVKNPYSVSKLEKISLNMGLGEISKDQKLLDSSVEELTLIAGQKAVVTRSKKSIANFKIREGMPVGIKVNLRGNKMWEFLDRLINVALPRVRDFRGVPSTSFDGRGNYTLGINDHLIFLELDYTKVDRSKGLNITICMNAKNDEKAYFILKGLGMPFSK